MSNNLKEITNEEKQIPIQEGNQIESPLPPAILRG